MEWQGPELDRAESLMFLYDGVVIEETTLRLAPDELLGYRFVAEADLDAYLSERLATRVAAALTALREGRFVELEHGHVVPAEG